MFAKLFTFFALVAVALASPKPDVYTYAAPGVAPLTYSGYAGYSAYAAPVAYASPYTAAYPYAYSGAYYVR